MKQDRPILTAAVVGLFVLGMLYKNYLGQIKQWIHDKVAESGAGSSGQPSRFGPGGQVQIQAPGGDWIDVPGAGGNPQIAPGVG